MERLAAPAPDYHAPLFIAGGESTAQAIDALFTLDEPCGTCIVSSPPVIATRARAGDRELALLRHRLGARVVTPPSRTSGLLPRPGDWITVDISSRGARLSKAVLHRSLFESEMLFAYADLDRAGADDIAIGLWRNFARGWERFGAGLGVEGAALAAEIALAVVVRRYYLSVTLDGVSLAVATPDPIVAEIAGRAALRMRQTHPDDMMIAPWEAPLVQRAAELRLGVQTPDAIALVARRQGGESDESRFNAAVRRLADLMSVSFPAERDASAT